MTRFEARVLGPIELVIGERVVTIAAARAEVVLAMLLLEAGQVVTVDRLIDATWGSAPPSTARSQVQICVSQLRKTLTAAGDDVAILTGHAGYRLQLPHEALDLQVFRKLVVDAGAAVANRRLPGAVAAYRSALELWRGEACAGVESQIVAQAVTRLRESRLTAIGDLMDLELTLGHHHQLISELSELVERHPLLERLRGQLMLALHRAGRSADALDVYRVGRAILMDELGLDPGRELQALQRAILTRDAAVDPQPRIESAPPAAAVPEAEAPAADEEPAASPVPQLLPPTTADFCGRRTELASIFDALDPAGGEPGAALHMPIVVLTGRGGVGKTTLAIRAAHMLRDRYPDGVLFARLVDRAESAIADPGAEVLERFLRALGVRPGDIPDGVVERADLFRTRVADRRILVVVDAAAGVGQIEPLLPGGGGCAVIVTCRNRLAGLVGAYRFTVAPMDPDTGLSLLTSTIGESRVAAEPEACAELIELCEGLPLALRIVAAKLSSRPHWRVRQLVDRLVNERLRLDELAVEGSSVRATLDFAYRSLSETQRKLLRRLSIVGASDFGCWVAAALLDSQFFDAEDQLELLVEAELVQAWISADGGIRYQLHDLVRLYVAEHLAQSENVEERQQVLERYLGCWLALAEEAHRRHFGGDFSVLHGRGRRVPLPPEYTRTLLQDPIGWFHRERGLLVQAIHLAARSELDELCWDLAMSADTLFESGPFPADWKETHTAALVATRKAGNDRGTAALLHSLGVLATTRQLDDAERLLCEALALWEKVRDLHGRALTRYGLAGIERLRGNYAAAKAGYSVVLGDFREVGDLAGEASVLRSLGQIEAEQGSLEAARLLLVEAVEVAGRAGARRDRAQASFHLARLCRRLGDLPRALTLLMEVCRDTRESGDVVGEAYATMELGLSYAAQGDSVRVRENLRAAAGLAEHSGDVLLRSRILLATAEAELADGRAAAARDRAGRALESFEALGSSAVWRVRCLELLGRAYAALGRENEAREAWHAGARALAGADPELAERLAGHLSEIGAEAAGAA
ncbi:MAG TPA: BTAD domain-containing putative transcriptional regulator [Actinospica sp.]|nr:BTAD domain-containing putative transcriptional regulator [Actinospica sp.]